MEVPSCHSCVVSLRADAGISIFKLDEILSIVSRFEIIDSGIWSKTPKTGMTSLTVWDIDVLHRSSISVVRDFGAIHCPPTTKFLRSKNAQI